MADTVRLSKHQTLRIVSSTPETLEVESTWAPHRDPPQRHFHPDQDERFEILEGELTVELADVTQVVAAVKQIEVPRGTVHRMWNAGPADQGDLAGDARPSYRGDVPIHRRGFVP